MALSKRILVSFAIASSTVVGFPPATRRDRGGWSNLISVERLSCADLKGTRGQLKRGNQNRSN